MRGPTPAVRQPALSPQLKALGQGCARCRAVLDQVCSRHAHARQVQAMGFARSSSV